MAQISRRPVKKELADKINHLFEECIVTCKSQKETAEYLDDLLTSTEKIMLSKRIAVAYLILKGHSYRDINKTIKVSNPTIRTVSLILKYQGGGIREILRKVAKRQEWRRFFEELGEILVDAVGKGKGGNWKAAESFKYQRRMEKQSPF